MKRLTLWWKHEIKKINRIVESWNYQMRTGLLSHGTTVWESDRKGDVVQPWPWGGVCYLGGNCLTRGIKLES